MSQTKPNDEQSISLVTELIGLPIENAIWNAAGALCTTEKELHNLGQSQSGVILSKSCTLDPREGNPLPRYWCSERAPFMTINSTGLANQGYKFYGKMGYQLSAEYDKPYIISVSGLSIEDNLNIIKELQGKCHAIELNLSCPNVIGKPQIGYDFDATQDLLNQVFSIPELNTPLGLKMPPYFDLTHFDQMADIINQFPISFITCINSLGNGLIIDPIEEKAVIKPKNGLGGIGGSIVRPIALSNVYNFRKRLNSKIDVIGCGGVRTGWDVFEHILAGATAVQVGSQLVEEGTSCFERIQKELKEIMRIKGYLKLEDFRGKLQSM